MKNRVGIIVKPGFNIYIEILIYIQHTKIAGKKNDNGEGRTFLVS